MPGSEFFFAHFRDRREIVADEVEIDIDLLTAFEAVSAVRSMDNNLINELIEHLICQLGDVLILPYQSYKTVDVGLPWGSFFLFAFKFRNTALELGFFLIILPYELLYLTLRHGAADLALIEAFDQSIDLRDSFSGCIQLSLLIRRVLCLLQFPLSHQLVDEGVLVFQDILGNCLDCFQKSSFKLLDADIMGMAAVSGVAVLAALEASGHRIPCSVLVVLGMISHS